MSLFSTTTKTNIFFCFSSSKLLNTNMVNVKICDLDISIYIQVYILSLDSYFYV